MSKAYLAVAAAKARILPPGEKELFLPFEKYLSKILPLKNENNPPIPPSLKGG
jgi:hypothetical protein